MEIQSINTFNIKRNYPEKETKTFQDKRQFNIQKSATEISSNYNISFHGLFNKASKETDAAHIMQTFFLEPGKNYLISDDTSFYLGDYLLSLKSPSISPTIEAMKPTEEIIFGREGFDPGDMDLSVSRKHLKISKNKNGQLVAQDIGSKFGTLIMNNIILPNTSQGSFKLIGGKKYLFPFNSILAVSNCPLFLSDYEDKFKQMKDGDTISVGRNPNSYIKYNDPYVSEQHLMLEKYKNGVIVTDLNSTNGTTFQKLSDIPLPYQKD